MTQLEVDDRMTLGQARALLRSAVDDGAVCPCCTQFAKKYRRKIHASMARDLIHVWRKVGYGSPFHAPTLLAHNTKPSSGEFAKLAHWGFIAELAVERDDGARHAGHWQITQRGAAYVVGELAAPKYAVIYDGRCLGLDGELADIRDALGKRFNYAELMAGV